MYTTIEYLLRILLSIGLGFAIGFERKMRFKEAGLRTHAIVSAGAAIFMIVSKYGFEDSGHFDASRIASQIVTGIGFLGAGMIMYRKQVVHNLTTAAGVWATAGIGMCAGAGLYLVAVGSTVLIILTQCFMHLNCSFFKVKRYMQLKVVFIFSEEAHKQIKEYFHIDNFKKVSAERQGDGKLKYTVILLTEQLFTSDYLYEIMSKNDYILSIERADEDI